MPSSIALIACSLNGSRQCERLDEWKSLLVRAASRGDVPGGLRFVFRPAAEYAERVRRLAVAEQACCSFLRFQVVEDGDAVVLTVETDTAGQEVLGFIFS